MWVVWWDGDKDAEETQCEVCRLFCRESSTANSGGCRQKKGKMTMHIEIVEPHPPPNLRVLLAAVVAMFGSVAYIFAKWRA